LARVRFGTVAARVSGSWNPTRHDNTEEPVSLLNLRRAALRAGIALMVVTACSNGESGGNPTDPTPPQEPNQPKDPGQPADPAPPGVTACGLVTQAQLESILGASLTGGEETEGAQGVTTCAYLTTENLSAVSIMLNTATGEQQHAGFPFADPQPVTGLGDDAKFAAQAELPGETSPFDSGSVLSVLQGPVVIQVNYSGEGDRLAISTAIAEVALGQL
jgi:Protein of unknown function (DUF3558)